MTYRLPLNPHIPDDLREAIATIVHEGNDEAFRDLVDAYDKRVGRSHRDASFDPALVAQVQAIVADGHADQLHSVVFVSGTKEA